jgi:pimeloyl-ACP methyl ester carboxylesterase
MLAIGEVLTNEQLVTTLEALLDQLGLESPHLVGISMGGEAALVAKPLAKWQWRMFARSCRVGRRDLKNSFV